MPFFKCTLFHFSYKKVVPAQGCDLLFGTFQNNDFQPMNAREYASLEQLAKRYSFNFRNVEYVADEFGDFDLYDVIRDYEILPGKIVLTSEHVRFMNEKNEYEPMIALQFTPIGMVLST